MMGFASHSHGIEPHPTGHVDTLSPHPNFEHPGDVLQCDYCSVVLKFRANRTPKTNRMECFQSPKKKKSFSDFFPKATCHAREEKRRYDTIDPHPCERVNY